MKNYVADIVNLRWTYTAFKRRQFGMTCEENASSRQHTSYSKYTVKLKTAVRKCARLQWGYGSLYCDVRCHRARTIMKLRASVLHPPLVLCCGFLLPFSLARWSRDIIPGLRTEASSARRSSFTLPSVSCVQRSPHSLPTSRRDDMRHPREGCCSFLAPRR